MSKIKLLIVDDRFEDTFLMRDTIERHYPGTFDIYEASDGEQGISIIKDVGIDMCLVDINMPKMSGIEMLMELGNMDIRITCIMMTTSSSDEDISDSKKYGASAYMTKPTNIVEYKDSIKALVSVFVNKIFKFIDLRWNN